MGLLPKPVEDHLKSPADLVDISSVADVVHIAFNTSPHILEHGIRKMEECHIRRSIRFCANKPIPIFDKDFFTQPQTVFAAHIEKVKVQNAMDDIHQRNLVLQLHVLRPQCGVGIFDRVVIFILTGFGFAVPDAWQDGRAVVNLVDLLEINAREASDLVIGDTAMELRIVGQNEELLDVITLDRLPTVISIVVANFDHFTDKGADDEQRVSVEGGNWVVDNDDFILQHAVFITALDAVIEIKERQEVALAVA